MRRLPGKDADVGKVKARGEGDDRGEMAGQGHRSDQHEFDPTLEAMEDRRPGVLWSMRS